MRRLLRGGRPDRQLVTLVGCTSVTPRNRRLHKMHPGGATRTIRALLSAQSVSCCCEEPAQDVLSPNKHTQRAVQRCPGGPPPFSRVLCFLSTCLVRALRACRAGRCGSHDLFTQPRSFGRSLCEAKARREKHKELHNDHPLPLCGSCVDGAYPIVGRVLWRPPP